MSWYNPLSWGRETKDRSFDEILRLMFTNMTSSGESVTPSTAMRCTTVQAIVRALTNAIGTYRVGVVQELIDADGHVTTKARPEHPLNAVLKNPNRYMTGTQYWRRCMTHVTLWGNHWSIKGRGNNGEIQFLNPIYPERVSLDEERSTEFSPWYRITTDNSEPRSVSYRNLLHITGGISLDGPIAPSPVVMAAEAIALALATERLQAELYGNGSIPSFLLTGGKFQSKEQYETWVSNFRQVYGAGSQRGSVAMLPEGMDAKEITFKPVDAQLLEARRFQRTEIASVWGVPPHKLADLERATFSNIEHQTLEFVQDAMLPYIRNFEESMTRDLLSEEDRAANLVVRFDMDAAERADFKSRVEGYSKLYTVGAMSPNEIRAREGMNPRKGGDEFATQLNMRTNGEPDEDAATDDDEGNDPESAEQAQAG